VRTFIRFARLSIAFCFAVTCFFSIGQLAKAASFECNKAHSAVEVMICLDPSLSKQDEVMADLYRRALKSADNEVSIRQSQRDWQRLIRNQCSTFGCLTTSYASRIAALREGRALGLDNSLTALSFAAAAPAGVVSYIASADYKEYADWMKNAQVLEQTVALVAEEVPRSALPSVVGWQCEQVSGAFYLAQRNMVVICYQFVKELSDYRVAQMKEPGSSDRLEASRLFSAIQFTVLHEIGHALLHRRRDAGSLGQEEAEADTFASVYLLSTKNGA
jgi:uncharacterized protein